MRKALGSNPSGSINDVFLSITIHSCTYIRVSTLLLSRSLSGSDDNADDYDDDEDADGDDCEDHEA